MMSDFSIVGIAVLFISIIFSRIISEKAFIQLSPEQKISIVDSFSKMRIYNLIPIAIILLAFFLLEKFLSLNNSVVDFSFLAALSVFLIIFQLLSVRKLKKLDLPEKYINKYFFSRLIVMSGFIFWIAITLSPTLV